MATRRSFRLEMLQVARLAPKTLGESAALVEDFLRTQLTSDGGFADRQGRTDLYYTVFGLESLLALRAGLPVESAVSYVRGFGDGRGLDFVHACSLARCHANLGGDVMDEAARQGLAAHIETWRTPDGGYHGTAGKQAGSAYGGLLAWGAYNDLGVPMPGEARLGEALAALALADGSFANEPGLPQGTTTTTAAAVTLARHLSFPLPAGTGQWLLGRAHSSGGFLAAPRAPLPDLLSTATALHALQALQIPFGHLKESCLDFIDSLWSAEGGFHGHWADDHLDVEYTSYGLLALGHLSV